MSKIFIEVFRGESAYFISEHYQLQPRSTDTQRDTFFLNRDIIEWKSRAIEVSIGKDTYYVIFNCDIQDKVAFLKKYHSLKESGKVKKMKTMSEGKLS